MHSSTNLQSVLPGVFASHLDYVSVSEADGVVRICVLPKQDMKIQLHFLLLNEALNKQYEIEVEFKEPHASVDIAGLYQLDGKNKVDIRSTMQHLVPHCESTQVWKGVLHDDAKAQFDGKIIVHPDAQKTVANLSNRNLLLSKTAQVNTKPTLEIYADDVKCSHGATVGFLDQEALFYLRSRGIDENTARNLLIDAFSNEIKEVGALAAA